MKRLQRLKQGIPSFIFEVVVIIIGVLLSLAITNWVQSRKDSRKETAFLRQIRQDLRDDLLALEYGLDFRSRQLEFASSTLQAINDPNRGVDLGVLVGGITDLITVDVFAASNVTFRSLESTGQLSLIENDSIINGLIDIYTTTYGNLRLNTDDINSFRDAFFLPYAINKFDFNGSMYRQDLRELQAIEADRTFHNYLVYYQISLSSTRGAYQRTIAQVRELLEIVEREIGE